MSKPPFLKNAIYLPAFHHSSSSKNGCFFVFFRTLLAIEPWHIPWVLGHRREDDKGALQEMHGAKVQGIGGKQSPWRCPNRDQRLGLGEHLPVTPSPQVKHCWDPRSRWWIQVYIYILIFNTCILRNIFVDCAAVFFRIKKGQNVSLQVFFFFSPSKKKLKGSWLVVNGGVCLVVNVNLNH